MDNVGFSKHLILLLWIWFFLVMTGISECSPGRPLIINFGDSNSDTGGVLAGTGLQIGLPHGMTCFHRGTGRLGDGSLIIDFFCKSNFSSTILNTSFSKQWLVQESDLENRKYILVLCHQICLLISFIFYNNNKEKTN